MTPDDFLGRVRDLVPAIRERTARAEQLRRLPDETFADFQEAGLFRAMQPKRYGGLRARSRHLLSGGHGSRAVCGRAPGSSGSSGFTTGTWRCSRRRRKRMSGARTQPPAVDLIGADRHGRAGGGRVSAQRPLVVFERLRFLPMGRARRHRAVPPRRAAARSRAFLVPRRDYEIDDNWQVMGLCGTGSKDIVVNDAFVPEYRTHSYLRCLHAEASRPGGQQRAALSAALWPRLSYTARRPRDRCRRWAPLRRFANSRGSASTSATGRALRKIRSCNSGSAGRRRDRCGARPHAAKFCRDDAARPRRRGDPAEVRARYRWDSGKATIGASKRSIGC